MAWRAPLKRARPQRCVLEAGSVWTWSTGVGSPGQGLNACLLRHATVMRAPVRGAAAAARPKRYMPFAEGPRNCVGQSLAKLSLATVVATLLQTFSFRLADEVALCRTRVSLPYPMAAHLEAPVQQHCRRCSTPLVGRGCCAHGRIEMIRCRHACSACALLRALPEQRACRACCVTGACN